MFSLNKLNECLTMGKWKPTLGPMFPDIFGNIKRLKTINQLEIITKSRKLGLQRRYLSDAGQIVIART